MKPCEVSLKCELCDSPSEYVDSVPNSQQGANHAGESGYRWQPLCWLHAGDRRFENTSRLSQILRCENQGLARLDRDRASGLCRCECGRLYFNHPKDVEYEFLNVLCDGSVVKL